jgi:hypothetical protein
MKKRMGVVLTALFLSSGLVAAQSIPDSNDLPFATNPQPASGDMVANGWMTLSWQPGSSSALHELYISDDFNDVNEGTVEAILTTDAFQVVGSLGTPIPSGLVADTTYYWRVDEVNEADPNSPWIGDIWEFTVAPPTAWNPAPADAGKLILGTWDIRLSWNAGLGAMVHNMYFSEVFEDVNDAPLATGTVTMETHFDPGPLDPNKTFYWRVDEYDGNNRIFHRGAVWSFHTTEWIVLDDFEQYSDEDPNWIWLTWQDGFETNGTGALAGHLPAHDKPYTYETAIVHSGGKCLPLYYDNSEEPNYPVEGAYGARLMYSEATLPFDPQANWARQGNLTVSALVLWYRGLEDNAAASVSVVIADGAGKTAIVPGSPDMLLSTEWRPWRIDLAELAAEIDLIRVSSLSIRIGEPDNIVPGGAGLLYIDDIGLTAE